MGSAKGTTSLSAPRALYLICTAGLGDVLMVLAAVKALKARFDCPVYLCTHSKYLRLAKACKHVDDAFSNWQTLNRAIALIRRKRSLESI